ncbi:transformer-2 protein homolog alpha isoform X3 [Monodelphis domestica]|uniref:transformer-2 protein homolog alpha isoform X3 n=1 Tax=Monodelphis domestica TaxID=13616 RepID=UPI0024E1EF07|nr:transformer-2 protein homolog alpha isoform X3 [Monodelphis domestica]
MSDVEENNFEGRESRSQSKSPAGSPARVKSESRSGSRSPSRASKHSESHSRSRSKSRSRSRRHSHRRYTRSRSHSHSHRRRSRSRSYTPEYRRRRSRSHSPMSNRRRHTGSRANPDPNTCLGVFGLSLYTTERDLREVFSRYGPLSGVNVVYDQRTGRSRGFAFVYFERIDDSKERVSEKQLPPCPLSLNRHEFPASWRLPGCRPVVSLQLMRLAAYATCCTCRRVRAITCHRAVITCLLTFLCTLWRGQMEWNWMAEGSVWITPLLREHTPPHRASTWADLLIVEEVVAVVAAEVAEAVADVVTPITSEDMTEDMTDMKNMITEEDHHLHITVAIDHGQDPVPIAQDAIDELNGCY